MGLTCADRTGVVANASPPPLTPLVLYISSLSRHEPKPTNPSFHFRIIAQPHTSVSDSSFYKHIDCDLPGSSRARQLLIWCSSRALSAPTTGKDKGKGKELDPPPAPALPPLSEDQRTVLR